GETVLLVNRDRELVDSVRYGDGGVWPRGPDGYSPSLERICPTAPSDETANWAASKMPVFVKAGGSPGRTNDNFTPHLPPILSEVSFTSVPAPGQEVLVRVTAADT